MRLTQAEQVVSVVLKRSLPTLKPEPQVIIQPVDQRQSFEPEMVSIPAGEFLMGSPGSESSRDDDERQHRVSVGAFRISKYEITFEEFDAFVRATGRELADDRGWGRGNLSLIHI